MIKKLSARSAGKRQVKKSTVYPRPSYTTTLMLVGKKLIELRVKQGYKTQSDFALAHDLPYIQYWRMEKGAANITFKSLDKVLSIHGLTIEKFFKILLNEKAKINQ
jgi:hypothetical protein